MVIKIPAFQKFEKVNTYMTFSFKPSLGCNGCSLARRHAATVFPPFCLATMSQYVTFGQGTACSLSAVLKSLSQVFDCIMSSLILF
jgi:hypothetical protein